MTVKVHGTNKAKALSTPSKRARTFKRTADRHATWIGIGAGRSGLSLGYRPRTNRPGTWSAKLVHQGTRREALLGEADDLDFPSAATARSVLDYAGAIKAALAWAEKTRAAVAEAARDGTAGTATRATVADAVTRYIAWREERSLVRGRDARSRLTKHVLSDAKLSSLPLETLTAERLRAWRNGLSGLQPSTSNRLMNDFRAALTAALPDQVLPAALKAALRGFAGASRSRPPQVLSPAEVRSIVDCARQVDETFGDLVLLLAATGMRFVQVARVTVGDVQLGSGRVLVPSSAKGGSQKAAKLIPVPVGDDVVQRLEKLVRDRNGNEPLLIRPRGGPWQTASEMTERWKRTMALAGLPKSVQPYALRSSSIVRMLSAGVAVRFVAQLHDTGIGPLENNYTAHITDAVETAARAAIAPVTSADVVIPLDQVARPI
jgi:integrase